MLRGLAIALRVFTVICIGCTIWNLVEWFMYGLIVSLIAAAFGMAMSVHAVRHWWNPNG